MRAGIILYGPPAAGKDTVTQALHLADTRCSLFERLKVGGGRTEGYRMISESELANLADRGEIVWENRRYGAVYAVDRAGLSRHSDSGVPVLHLGQSKAIEAVKNADYSIAWLVVYLWCARDVAEQRMRGRNTGDVPARLSAWDATENVEADLRIDTGAVDPDNAARAILLAMEKEHKRH
ncbi:kinase [Micromonospora sp. DT228]|uniref:kinase n=1 Tax=Micromonospora sp. DT228 TaxID=3393443 RepID=UPI003CF25630